MIFKKILKYIVLILFLVLVVSLILKYKEVNDLNKRIKVMEGQEVQKKIYIRDSLFNESTEFINKSIKTIDSLKKLKLKIKYIRYEVPTYVNRDIDGAIRVLTDYTYATERDSANIDTKKINRNIKRIKQRKKTTSNNR